MLPLETSVLNLVAVVKAVLWHDSEKRLFENSSLEKPARFACGDMAAKEESCSQAPEQLRSVCLIDD